MKKLLRVWWIPQVPGKAFCRMVDKVSDGVALMNILADYDQFQLDNNIKPDYSNMGGIQVLKGGDISNDDNWADWVDEKTGEDDPVAWLAEQSSWDFTA